MRPLKHAIITASLLAVAMGAVALISALNGAQSAQGIKFPPFETLPPFGINVQINTATYPGITDGLCSLDEAIHATNINGVDDGCNGFGSSSGATDGISFAAGVTSINVTSDLPMITDKVDIDGSLGGGARVQLHGVGDVYGLHLETSAAAGSYVRNLVLNGFRTAVTAYQTTGITLLNNRIGTDAAGPVAVPNGTGVFFYYASGQVGGFGGVTPGGPCTGNCNLISGNTYRGIDVLGPSTVTIQGNFIGTDVTGTSAMGNGTGIWLHSSAPVATIGGTQVGAGNLVSGNGKGIDINVSANGAGSTIQGNLVGTNAAGTAAIANTGAGITISLGNKAYPVTVGGASASARNIVSGNSGDAVYLGTADNVNIFGNFIGTLSDGTTPLGNSGHGVFLSSSTHRNLIGGVNPGEGNVIAFNGLTGVTIGINNYDNQIRGNSIHNNSGKGIDLPDKQAGYAPNPPAITGATHAGASGVTCPGCIVDVYSDNADEGRTYEGTTTANGGGAWSYSGPLSGAKVTATATSPNPNYPGLFSTSEFSSPFMLPATPTPTPSPSPTPTATPTATPTPTATASPKATVLGATPTGTPPVNPTQGDINCLDGVDDVDAWLLLLFAAGLDDGETPGSCLDLGDPESNSGFPWGDVNCDNAVNAIDALYLVAYEAGVVLPPAAGNCFPIGNMMT